MQDARVPVPMLPMGNPLTLGTRTKPRGPVRTPPETRERSAFAVMAIVVAGLGVGMAATAWRDRLATLLPGAGPALAGLGLDQPNAGLSLENLRSSVGQDRKVLTVDGVIANTRGTSARVPDLRVVLRDRAAERVYSWTAAAPKAALAPGETIAFQSRLVSPPEAGHDLVVSFADPFPGSAPTPTGDGR